MRQTATHNQLDPIYRKRTRGWGHDTSIKRALAVTLTALLHCGVTSRPTLAPSNLPYWPSKALSGHGGYLQEANPQMWAGREVLPPGMTANGLACAFEAGPEALPLPTQPDNNVKSSHRMVLRAWCVMSNVCPTCSNQERPVFDMTAKVPVSVGFPDL